MRLLFPQTPPYTLRRFTDIKQCRISSDRFIRKLSRKPPCFRSERRKAPENQRYRSRSRLRLPGISLYSTKSKHRMKALVRAFRHSYFEQRAKQPSRHLLQRFFRLGIYQFLPLRYACGISPFRNFTLNGRLRLDPLSFNNPALSKIPAAPTALTAD